MKIFRLLWCVTLVTSVLLGTPLMVGAEDHAKDIAQIKQAYQKISAAANKKDVDGYLAYIHPAYKDIDKYGYVRCRNKEALHKSMASAFAKYSRYSLKIQIDRITFTKEYAAVNVTMFIDSIEALPQAEFTDALRCVNYWVKTPQGWLEYQNTTTFTNPRYRHVP